MHRAGRLTAGRLTIGLAGLSGSGKSYLADELARHLLGEVHRFGDYIRSKAQTVEASRQRHVLQDLGHKQVTANPEGFLDAFYEWARPSSDSTIILDGVRHSSINEALRSRNERTGRRYLLIAVRAEASVRASRRSSGSLDNLAMVDSHPVEKDSSRSLLQEADLTLSVDWTTADAISAIQALLDQKMVMGLEQRKPL